MKAQPTALFLADVLTNDPCSKTHHDAAAAELRRLHEENQRCKQVCAATADGWLEERDALLEALILLVAGIENSVSDTYIPMVRARAAIAKVDEQA